MYAVLLPQVKKGGRVVLIQFSDKNPSPWVGPRRIPEKELRSHFNPEKGWQVEALTDVVITHSSHSDYNRGLSFQLVATRL